MRETQPSGLWLDNSFFFDLDYADDVALLDNSFDSLSETLSRMKIVSSRFGLKINWSKTKIQNVGWGPDSPALLIDNNNVEVVDKFIYMCSSLAKMPTTILRLLEELVLPQL